MAVRGLGTFIFLPLSLAKTRKEGEVKVDFSFKTILKQYQISLIPSILRDSFAAGTYYMFYNYFKNISTKTDKNSNLPFTVVPFVSAVLSVCLTQPFDVLTQQRMLSNQKISTLDLMKNSNYFAGLLPRLSRKCLSNTILWLSFEYLREVL